MKKNEIINQVTDVLENILLVPKEIISDKNFDLPLTGDLFNLSDVLLTYLFLELRKRINFKIVEKKIASGAFLTIRKVVGYIEENTPS